MRLDTGWTGDVIIFHKTFLSARIYQYSCDIFSCRVIALISEALLSCAVKRRMITACPVAFGETDVKGRVMSLLNYKKPFFWILCTTVIAGVAVAAGFLTDPMPAQASDTGESISIIGGADGPTSIFLAGKLGDGSEEETGGLQISRLYELKTQSAGDDQDSESYTIYWNIKAANESLPEGDVKAYGESVDKLKELLQTLMK